MIPSARRLLLLTTGLLGLALGGTAAPAQVVINEIHYNPLGDDATVQLEFIELHNSGPATVDLGLHRLVFGPEPVVFPPGTSIPAGGYLVVAERISTLQAATGHTAALEWLGLNTGLGNGSDQVDLLDPALALLDRVAYTDSAPWPTAPDGSGPSLELTSPTLDNALAGAWKASIAAMGTPGARNSTFSSAPIVSAERPYRSTAVAALPTVQVTFSKPVSGVVAANLTVNGSAATTVDCPSCVSGLGSGPYTFTGFAPPVAGSASIVLAPGAIQSGGLSFAGDAWTVSVGIAVVFNELHYHPRDPDGDAEFIEFHNPGTAPVDMSGWAITEGLDVTFGAGSILAPGGYLVVALNPALLQSLTGYAGALPWASGRLSNGGESLVLEDASGNRIDSVNFGDSGDWPTAPDGDGPTLELVHPGLPNQYGAAWTASLRGDGTPGAANSTYDPAPKPIITGVSHAPAIPAGGQSVTITARVLDDVAVTAVTLYHRQDRDPTIAYAPVPMFDDGAHGDGAAGDDLYGAVVTGLPDGERLDFTLRATDGVGASAAPAGHNTLVAGEYPAQTYLAKFSNTPPPTDFPSYHLVTTQRTRNLQEAHNEDEHDATFLRCNSSGCEIFYNVVERYRGQSSLGLHPHSFRVNFPSSNPLASEMGFDVTRLNLHSQSVDKQHLGYEFFRESFGGTVPASRTQFVRLHTSPLSHGGVQDHVYINVERVDDDFLASQDGNVLPLRFPDRCSVSRAPCETAVDCAGGESCVASDDGNLYRGRVSGDLQYLGTNKESYRGSYDKETNADADAWTDLIDQCFALDPDTTGEASYEAAISAIADEDEWARWFALNLLLGNQEGGVYRDTGDDYYLYFLADGSPFGRDSRFIPVDLDSVFGGLGSTFAQETIWRTSVQTTQRFVRSNAFAGRFVGAICELHDGDFRPEVMNPRIDALPDAVANAARKQALKDWVVARRNYVAAEIKRDLTLTGVPSSPYTSANPVISVGGQLNQCGTRFVTVNDAPATFNVFNASWAAAVTLSPGPNTIVVRNLDHFGNEIEREEATVTYAPPGGTNLLRLTLPRRMLADRTQTLRAEVVDSLGRIVTSGCPQWGTISARRLSDNSVVPVSVTQFDDHLSIPEDGIRFYSGLGTVSFTLDGGAAVGSGDIEVSVTVDGLTASKIVTVEAAPVFRELSGTLSGSGLTWGPDENIRIKGNTTVPAGRTLNILPGTLIMVDTTGSLGNGTLIQVEGAIAAAGTADKPIHFFSERGRAAMTLTQSGSSSNAEAWQGIFHNGSGSSRYDYVFLTGAGNGTVIGHPRPPVLRFNNSHSFTMDHSTLADNNGMALAGPGIGSFTVRNTSISRCGIGAEFNGNGHNLLIEDSWWTSCGHAPEASSLDGDLMHIDGVSSTQMIRRSVIADGGDDGIDHSASTYTAQDLIIYDVVDKAVSMTGGFGSFSNVLIYGSATGIRGAASCTNCTIAVDVPMGSPSSVQQSIIWPSSLETCASNIDYTNVGNPADLGCGDGNLSTNPLYENTGECNYAPAAGSRVLTAGPAGERIGWLGFPEASTCQADAGCNDANPCTLDSCGDAGVCVFAAINGCSRCTSAAECEDGDPCTANTCGAEGTCQSGPAENGTSCDDGVACTLDACSAGTCVGTPDCPEDKACNSGNGLCEQLSLPQTVTFQQGVGGYAGVQDTSVAEAAATTNYGATGDWRWDTDDPSGSNRVALGLVRFDGIFGKNPGQVPPGATIQSATLTLVVFNGGAAPAGEVRQSLVDWSEATATWANFGGEAGVQPDEYGATVVAAAPTALGRANIDVTATLQAWSGATSGNFGWVFVPRSFDGLQVRSSEYPTVADGPKLSVTYRVAAGCTTKADCDDGDPCTVDSCSDGFCSKTELPPAAEVAGVTASGRAPTVLQWLGQGDFFGYDVLGGSVRALVADRSVAAGACLAADVVSATYSDTRPNPPTGDAYYYLVRAQHACSTGSYGSASAGAERVPRSDCP